MPCLSPVEVTPDVIYFSCIRRFVPWLDRALGLCIDGKFRILETMKTIALPSIPVSPDTAARFATLDEAQKRMIRMRVAIEIGRLTKPKSRADSAPEFRAAAAAVGNRARRNGLALTKLKRMIDASR